MKKAYSYYEMQLQGALTDLKKDLKLVGLFEVVQRYTTPSQTVTLGMHPLYTSKTSPGSHIVKMVMRELELCFG